MITVYSAVWCGFCHSVKLYFDRLGVKYEDRDVEQNPTYAKEAIDKSDQMGIPVIDIDGTIIVGFDKPKIDQVLKDKNLFPAAK
jgi:glutaredoxin-like YruB-family protein